MRAAGKGRSDCAVHGAARTDGKRPAIARRVPRVMAKTPR